jgi:hypothetical protein
MAAWSGADRNTHIFVRNSVDDPAAHTIASKSEDRYGDIFGAMAITQ